MGDAKVAIGGAGIGYGNAYMRGMVKNQLKANQAERGHARRPRMQPTTSTQPVGDTTLTLFNQGNTEATHLIRTQGPGAQIPTDTQNIEPLNPYQLAMYGMDYAAGWLGGGDPLWDFAMRIGRGAHELYSNTPREQSFKVRNFNKTPTTRRSKSRYGWHEARIVNVKSNSRYKKRRYF